MEPDMIDGVLVRLKETADPNRKQGMARYGIDTSKALGVSIPVLRKTAKDLLAGKPDRHALALALWDTEVHEARILASMVEDPCLADIAQAKAWAQEFNSWDLCDQCCMNLFRRMDGAWDMALMFSKQEPEFVKRAGFALMATLAVHARDASNEDFEQFFSAVMEGCADTRNYVKKAVNWALRQIGKRNAMLHARALEMAQHMLTLGETLPKGGPACRWIARDAIRELTDPAVVARLPAP
ncbi:MAG: DNA alkylation repair protein [Desulfovibrio sp.]|nr:MAG: DNA alkylation repair protein [Desulfovibrio sp.]